MICNSHLFYTMSVNLSIFNYFEWGQENKFLSIWWVYCFRLISTTNLCFKSLVFYTRRKLSKKNLLRLNLHASLVCILPCIEYNREETSLVCIQLYLPKHFSQTITRNIQWIKNKETLQREFHFTYLLIVKYRKLLVPEWTATFLTT